MRKKFMYFILIPAAIVAIVLYFFLNTWVERGIEEAGEEITGAKVEIEGLKITLFPLGMEWKSMQVADPNNTWTNLFETGVVKFAMDPVAIIKNKFIIETIEVHNLSVGSKRTTDGALPEGKSKASIKSTVQRNFSKLADATLKKALGSNPIFDVTKLKSGFKPDSLVAAFDSKTVKNIDSLKKKVDYAVTQWNGIKGDFEKSKSKILEVENNVKSINVNVLNSAPNILAAITKLDNAKKSLDDINNTVNVKGKAVTNYIQMASTSIDSIQKYADSDFQRLKAAAHIPSISMPGVAQLLVGSEMYDRIMGYLHWIDFGRSNVKKYSPDPQVVQTPPRFKGQDITFPVEHGLPKLWIKNIFLSYGKDDKTVTNSFNASGGAKNISDNQDLTGEPITGFLEGTADNIRKLSLHATLDRRKNVSRDEFTIDLAGVPLSEFKLGNSDFLPTSINGASISTQVKFIVDGDNLDGQLSFNISNINMAFNAEPKNLAETAVREILKSITSFNVGVRIWTNEEGLQFAFSTDLDDKISKRLNEVLGAEFKKLEDELKSKFYDRINQEKDKFEKQYGVKFDDIKKQVGDYQSLFTDKNNLIDGKKKELTDKLDKAKNNLIEDNLKGLFKK